MRPTLFQLAVGSSVVAHLVAAALWPQLSDRERTKPPVKISMASEPAPPPPQPTPAPEPQPDSKQQRQRHRAARTPTQDEETSAEPSDEGYAFDDDPMPQLPDVPSAKPAPRTQPSAAGASSAKAAAAKKARDDARRKYVALLQGRIASHRRYPYAAKRMQLEGMVQLTFRIGPSGAVSALRASGGAANVLKDAAKSAVNAAAPFPAPPSEHFPQGLTVHVGLPFRLTGR